MDDESVWTPADALRLATALFSGPVPGLDGERAARLLREAW